MTIYEVRFNDFAGRWEVVAVTDREGSVQSVGMFKSRVAATRYAVKLTKAGFARRSETLAGRA